MNDQVLKSLICAKNYYVNRKLYKERCSQINPQLKVEKEDVCPNLNIFKEKNLKTSGHI